MSQKTTDAYFVSLPDRGLIHVEGTDRKSFLQGIISNDINALKPGTIIYSCLLTPQGKFLHDFFIHEGEDFILIDCEGGARAQDLYKKLSIYKLRSDVKLSIEEYNEVYALLGDSSSKGLQDPRHGGMGARSFEKPSGLEEKEFDLWDKQRIRLCIPDGSRDIEVDRGLLLESRIDELSGVSFDKGCYMGQEVTARMHYRGLTKKHLYSITSADNALPETGSDIMIDGSYIGNMRSQSDNIGIALLKDSAVDRLPDIGLSLIKG